MYIYDKHSFVNHDISLTEACNSLVIRFLKNNEKLLHCIPAEKQYILCSVCIVQDAIGASWRNSRWATTCNFPVIKYGC